MLQVFATMQLASRRAKMQQQAEKYAKSAGARKRKFAFAALLFQVMSEILGDLCTKA